MWSWLTFVALALFTNTALGPPFDPVLLWFTVGRSGPDAWPFVVTGAVCAGVAGVVEASLGRRLAPRGHVPAWARPLTRGRLFYVFAAGISASPLPFTMVRIAALARRPQPLLYGAAVAAGRLPRYALTVMAWDRLGPWAGIAAAAVTLTLLAAVAARRLTVAAASAPSPAAR